jgi:hypothetical protein
MQGMTFGIMAGIIFGIIAGIILPMRASPPGTARAAFIIGTIPAGIAFIMSGSIATMMLVMDSGFMSQMNFSK